MTNTLKNDAFLDLEIYIAPRRDAHYPVRVRLGEEQEFDGALDAGILSWKPGGDGLAGGRTSRFCPITQSMLYLLNNDL